MTIELTRLQVVWEDSLSVKLILIRVRLNQTLNIIYAITTASSL